MSRNADRREIHRNKAIRVRGGLPPVGAHARPSLGPLRRVFELWWPRPVNHGLRVGHAVAIFAFSVGPTEKSPFVDLHIYIGALVHDQSPLRLARVHHLRGRGAVALITCGCCDALQIAPAGMSYSALLSHCSSLEPDLLQISAPTSSEENKIHSANSQCRRRILAEQPRHQLRIRTVVFGCLAACSAFEPCSEANEFAVQ